MVDGWSTSFRSDPILGASEAPPRARRSRWQTRLVVDVQDRIDQLIERQRAPLVEGLLLVKDVVLCQPHSTPTLGVNSTFFVVLDGAHEAFHKPFAGVSTHAAVQYGQDPDSVPLNECAAWRLAAQLGGLVAEIVAPCVLRSISGSAGSPSARRVGHPHAAEPFLVAPDQCRAAAFLDSLIAQQDRHMGNYRWDPHDSRLGLITTATHSLRRGGASTHRASSTGGMTKATPDSTSGNSPPWSSCSIRATSTASRASLATSRLPPWRIARDACATEA
jgi:hypothetical protein